MSLESNDLDYPVAYRVTLSMNRPSEWLQIKVCFFQKNLFFRCLLQYSSENLPLKSETKESSIQMFFEFQTHSGPVFQPLLENQTETAQISQKLDHFVVGILDAIWLLTIQRQDLSSNQIPTLFKSLGTKFTNFNEYLEFSSSLLSFQCLGLKMCLGCRIF